MTDSERDVARLLNEYASKPPNTNLTAEEQKHLVEFVKKDKTFRKLKDFVRMTAWQQVVPALNEDPADPDFATRFARNQGIKEGMLRAIDLLETFVEEENDS